MEIISTYYFDLYPIEQEDVIENFKNRIDKITSKLELKYDIHFEDETNLNMSASKMMGGGDTGSTYPYSMFENIFNYISNAKAKVIGNSQVSSSIPTPVENDSVAKPIDSTIISEPRQNISNEYTASTDTPLSKPIEKVEQIQTPTFKNANANTNATPAIVTEFPPEKHTEPLIEEKKQPDSHIESETDFESEIDEDSDNESIIDEMTKEIIRVQLNVYNVKEKGLELMMKIRK
jgi:hypothetical protein